MPEYSRDEPGSIREKNEHNSGSCHTGTDEAADDETAAIREYEQHPRTGSAGLHEISDLFS